MNRRQDSRCPGAFRQRRRPQFLGDLHELLEPLGGHEDGGFGCVDVGLRWPGEEVGEVQFGPGEAVAGIGEGGRGGVLKVGEPLGGHEDGGFGGVDVGL